MKSVDTVVENKGDAERPVQSRAFGVEAALMAAVRVVTRATGFLISMLVARMLGAEGRGVFAALAAPTALATNFSEMGIRQATAFYVGNGTLTAKRAVPTLLTMVLLSSALGATLSLVYFEIVGVAEGEWLWRALAAMAILPSLAVSYATGVFLGQKRIADFRKLSWQPPIVRLVAIAAGGWVLGMGLSGVLAANLLGAFLGAGYALRLLGRNGPLRLGYDRRIAAMLHRKGLSYAVSLFILMVNYRIMTLLLTIDGDMVAVGLYAQAALMAELLWEVPNTLSALVLSRAVTTSEEEKAAFSGKVMSLARVAVALGAAASLCLAIAAPFFFPLVFGPDFARSADLCVALLPGVVAFTLFKILNIDVAGRGKPWVTMIVMLPVLLLNIGLGWWAVREAGAMGAALASSVSFIVASFAYLFVYARVVGVSPLAVVTPTRTDLELLRRALGAFDPRRKFKRKA
ncbi:lipopolysaccharide biosynthesis protein [Sphingomonas lenta]|nr:polysaccharide biosynthesis C-terminal domain-containing protein [Sphingomonas lenta]